jgi:hypothetical protein
MVISETYKILQYINPLRKHLLSLEKVEAETLWRSIRFWSWAWHSMDKDHIILRRKLKIAIADTV